MSFFNNLLISSSTSIVVTIISILSNIIVTRALGPSGRGIYAVVSNLIVFLVLIFGEGIKRSNTILIGEKKDNLKFLVFFTLKFSALLALFLSLAFILKSYYLSLLPNISAIVLILTFSIAIFTILWQAFQALLLGMQQIIAFNILLMIQASVIFIVNILGITIFNFGVNEFILALLLSAVITSLYCLMRLIMSFKKIKSVVKISPIKIAALTSKSTIASLSMFLTLRGDIFLINYFLNPFQAGLYAIAVLFSEIMQKIPNVIGPLILSKTVNDTSNKPAEDTAKLFRVILFANLLIVLFLIFFGKWIIILLFGSKFSEAFLPLLYLLPALLFLGSGGVAHALFMGRAYPNIVILINLLTGFINISLNIILIPKYGIKAAAAVSSITYTLWTLGLSIYLSIKYKIKLSKIFFTRSEDFTYVFNSLKSFRLRGN